MFVSLVAKAYTGEAVIDGIKYYVITKGQTAEVIANNYSNSITIPSSISYEGVVCNVISIGKEAFMNCTNLTAVTIPNSVKTISNHAFDGCTGLTSLLIPGSVTSIGNYAFRKCSSLSEIIIPNSVQYIESYAFSGCTGIKTIIIPDAIEHIAYNAFDGCSKLSSITILSKKVYLGNYVFANCKELEDVFVYAEKLPWSGNTSFWDRHFFEGSFVEYATLHVPATAIEWYKSADNWRSFGTIIALGSVNPDNPNQSNYKCAKPTIYYSKGKLLFNCSTEGASCQSTITDSDITTYSINEVQLSVTYNISVYASKPGYENSDVATATLCWIDVDPKTEGISNDMGQVRAKAVLIQSIDGQIVISGIDDGTRIYAYEVNGRKVGSAISYNGQANLITNLKPGSIVIIKIGEKSVKVTIR